MLLVLYMKSSASASKAFLSGSKVKIPGGLGLFQFQTETCVPKARFRRRIFLEPNLIRIKAYPNYLDSGLISFRRRTQISRIWCYKKLLIVAKSCAKILYPFERLRLSVRKNFSAVNSPG